MLSIHALALVISLAAPARGTATPTAPPPAPNAVMATARSAQIMAPGQAKLGDRAHCAVTGDTFVVKASSPHAAYKGRTYYFCCPDCVDLFTNSPEKYLGATAT